MPRLTDSVGDGGTNKTHDVAIVQLMLRVVKDAKNAPYLNTPYSGNYDDATKQAIIGFQTDQKLLPAVGAPAGGVAEKKGVIAKDSVTLQKLNAVMPAALKDARIIEGTRTVYLPADAGAAQQSRHAIETDPQLEAQFKQRVGQLVQTMYDTHKIALWLTPTGSRRTFAQQAAEVHTKAGPGESNHNFGRAVDIGFKHLRWVDGNGTTVKDAAWLNALEKVSAAKAGAFWDARDAIAKPLPLYRLQFERVHLQSYDQATASSRHSLVKLLNTVGKMKWGTGYKSDLGLGGAMIPVGTAKQIWAEQSPITKTQIAHAKTAVDKAKKQWKDTDVSDQDLKDVRRALKADFELADHHWIKWVPVK